MTGNEDDRRDPFADVFTVAVLKGAVEGDVYRHFGSLGGFEVHLATARRLGLVDGEADPSARARDLYRRHRLDHLPDGRAYLVWHDSPIVEAALAELLPEAEPMSDQEHHGAGNAEPSSR